ncbi:DUF3352 domain-containing protein [Acaryochloris marina]|uniref:DUF3352 domain-containing protein n=1 Tax=Acaryochloris marina (strain MBIC 11017) TaxID=329726 RepID=B0C413_ACAM1|nr:DUF3352 domain-containing protein [Acaryochloris marina]ABW26273.1 conserved hypothetical protein [Acaryochloris marina MBIC11017]
MAKKWKYIIPGIIAGVLGLGGVAAYLYLKVIPAQQGTSTLAIAKIVPDEAWMTASINLDFEAWQKLEQFGTSEAQKLYKEGLDTLIKELDQELAEDNLSYSKDFKPWLGNAMMAFLPEEKSGGTPEFLVVIGIKDKLAALDFYNKVKKEDSLNIQETKQYKGVEIVKIGAEKSDNPGYVAILENHLAASDQVTTVKKAIDASQGAPSLGTTGVSAKAFQSLELENSVAQFHILDYAEIIDQLDILDEADAPEIPPELEERFKQVKSVSVGMGIDDQGIRFRSVTQFDPKLWKGQFDPIPGKIISRFPANTLLSANGGNIKKQWPLYVDHFSNIPEFASAIDAIRIYVRQTTRLDLDRDIISWMDGEVGFALIPSKEGILEPVGFGGALVFDTSDRKKATATFAKLDTFAKQNNIKISNSKIGDVKVTHWQVPPLGQNVIGRGWLDDNTMFVTVGQPIAQVMANRPKKTLDKSDIFQSVTQSLPQDSGYFYVNMEEVNQLLFSYPDVANNSEFNTPEVKAILNSIRGIGMANAQTDSSTLTSEFLLALKSKK